MAEMPGWNDFNPNNPYTQLALLAQRVAGLSDANKALEATLEHERGERAEHEKKTDERITKMENSFQRGAGILLVLPVLGTMIGILIAYGKTIFAPWSGVR
jgi:hypothetical protein